MNWYLLTVIVLFIFFAPEGLQLPYAISLSIGAGITTLILSVFFIWWLRKKRTLKLSIENIR